MSVFRRAVPAAVRAVATDERRLAWAVTDKGTAVVATPVALHHADLVLPWTQVAKVGWEPPALTVREIAEVDGTGALHRFVLAQDEGLAQVVRAQVTSSVAWSEVRRLQPRGRVRLVARRVPGRDALLWQTVWVEGTDPGDTALREQAEELVEALRGTLG